MTKPSGWRADASLGYRYRSHRLSANHLARAGQVGVGVKPRLLMYLQVSSKLAQLSIDYQRLESHSSSRRCGRKVERWIIWADRKHTKLEPKERRLGVP